MLKLCNIIIFILASPVVSRGATDSTSISLSWTQSGSSVDRYTVSYNYTIRGCGSGPVSGSVNIIDGNARSLTLTGLEEDSDYTITLTAHRGNRRVNSNSIFTNTNRAGTATILTLSTCTRLQYSVVYLSVSHCVCHAQSS